jgi:hypothetical protein
VPALPEAARLLSAAHGVPTLRAPDLRNKRQTAQILTSYRDLRCSLISVMSLDVAEGQIQGVSSIINPDKLRHLGPLADLGALLRERS